MKALSIYPAYAMQIAKGEKREEYRSYPTKYRGDLLICSTKAHGVPGTIPGKAICVVELVDCKKVNSVDYAWKLKKPRYIKPVHVKGQQRIFNVDIEPEYRLDNLNKKEKQEWLEKYFYPEIIGAREENGRWLIPRIKED